MIQYINTLLTPIEKIIKEYKKFISYFFYFLSFAAFGFFFVDNGIKESGEKALLVLWIILWMPILSRVLGLRIFQLLLPLRQELGILMGVLAFVHSAAYVLPDPGMLGESHFWLDNVTGISYLAIGFIALIFTISLTLTSNKWAMRLMGHYWKILHRTVYIIIILTVIHVVLIEWGTEFEVGPVIILVAYFGFKILEWRRFSFVTKDTHKSLPKGQKWLCVPCGYIYDPVIGDEEHGIKAGTEFQDIPDNWRCPECGVTKSDFVPVIDNGKLPIGYNAYIVEKIFLNTVTLKLVIQVEDELQSIPGQFVSFIWLDNEGEFNRSYSIAEHDGKQLTFIIKLTEHGRGARLLRDIASDATIRIRGIFGKFVLQDTLNPKIFIATGTGLAPIYNMIRALPKDTDKSLYFTVSTGSELFYIDELRAIENLDLHIHTTKEEVSGYSYGRVDVDTIVATPDTEWYLCGNLRMVTEAREKLSARGYERVYSEEFN